MCAIKKVSNFRECDDCRLEIYARLPPDHQHLLQEDLDETMSPRDQAPSPLQGTQECEHGYFRPITSQCSWLFFQITCLYDMDIVPDPPGTWNFNEVYLYEELMEADLHAIVSRFEIGLGTET